MIDFIWVPSQSNTRQTVSLPWIIELDAVTERGNPLSTFGYLTYNYDLQLAVYSFRAPSAKYDWRSDAAFQVKSMDEAIHIANCVFAAHNYRNLGAPHHA